MGGIIRKPKRAAPAPEPVAMPEPAPIQATRGEREAAARRRMRRGGMRSLLGGGRQAGGDEGNQTTLGAG